MLNESHLVILIETTEGKKFGCYVSKEIGEIGKYVDDTSSAINYISMMDSFISVNGS